MKYVYLFLLLCLLSCSTRRQVGRTVSATVDKTDTAETISNEAAQSLSVIDSEKNEQEDTQIHLIVYDASQPVAPETGRPPVKAELFQTTGRKTGEKSNAKQLNRSEQSEKSRQNTNIDGTLNAEETTSTSADVAGGKNLFWVWIAAIIVAGFLVYLFTSNSFTKK